jgi:glycosyltransferase involved in cell wall biosynthesis
VFYEYANRLSDRGYQVMLVFPGHERRAKLKLALRPILGRMGRDNLFPWFDLSSKVRVRYVLDNDHWTIPRTDVLIFGGWETPKYYRQLHGRALRTVQLVWAYDVIASSSEHQRRVEEALSNERIPVVAGSSVAASMLTSIGRTPLRVVCPGVDTKIFQPHANRTFGDNASSSGCTIGLILRGGISKGTNDGISAMNLLRARGYEFSGIAVGRHRAWNLPPWISIRTAIDDKAMAAFYNDCSIFLVPSRAEGFGLPALEAMACGTAVISTDNGGVGDIASPDDNILLTPVEDPAAMADKLALLLADDHLRERIARSGFETSQRFSWERSVDEFESVLNELIA